MRNQSQSVVLEPPSVTKHEVKNRYVEALTLIERLHRRLLDVIKDEFERQGDPEVNAVQALLLFNIGDAELTAGELKKGYDWAYQSFYNWSNIFKASLQHEHVKYMIKHFAYAGGWKKFEPLWNFMIKTKGLNKMLPLLESILSDRKNKNDEGRSPFPAIA